MRLCSRAKSVCTAVSPTFPFARVSPATIASCGVAMSAPNRSSAGAFFGVAPRAHLRQVPVVHQQGRRVVRGPAVDLADAQPVEPLLGDAVDVRRVDVAAQPVDVLPRRRHTRAVRGRSAPEVDRVEVVSERLERIGGAEPDRLDLDHALVSQAEVVVEELSPDPAPLRDVVLGEQVLPDVVEDPVADEPRGPRRRHRDRSRPRTPARRFAGNAPPPRPRSDGARCSLVRRACASARPPRPPLDRPARKIAAAPIARRTR